MSNPPTNQAQTETTPNGRRHLLTLQAISSRISTVSDLDQLLDELIQGVKSIFGHANAMIFLVDEDSEELYLAATGNPTDPGERPFDTDAEYENLANHVVKSETPILIHDWPQSDWCLSPEPDARAKIAVPMSVGGRPVGVFEVESDRVGAFDEQDLQLMITLANQAAAIIEAVRLLQKSRANAMALEQRARKLMLINRISTTLNSSLDAYEILNMTIRHLVEISNVNYGAALIFARNGNTGQIVTEYPDAVLTNLRLTLSLSPSAQRMLELGIPYAIEDATNHPFLTPIQEASSLALCSVLLVPLVTRREMIGVMFLVSSYHPRTFTEEQMESCQTIASQAAAAVANARLLQDIQQQRRALARKSQEMTEESSKLDAILNNIADGLVVTDPDGKIMMSNPAFREIANLPPTHPLYGHPLAESFPLKGLPPLVTQALEQPGQVFTEDLELADGRVLQTTTTTLRIPPPIMEPEQGEQIAGVVSVFRDITHEVEVDRMKTDFISTVSHELRSPLTSIVGFTDLIQRDLERWIMPHVDDESKAEQIAQRIVNNLSIIENESRRLSRLINDMLDIAKIESGQIAGPMESVDMEEVIQDGVAASAALAAEKGLALHVDLPPENLPPVWGHYDRLMQVITNLLSNSIKFTPQGEIQVHTDVVQIPREEKGKRDTLTPSIPDALSPGTWLIVHVTDTGIGIQAKEIPRLFEKFTQIGDPLTEKPPGTGLGLSICKGIIDHHRGHIWVESEPGRGSTFSFALPTQSAQMRPALATEPPIPDAEMVTPST